MRILARLLPLVLLASCAAQPAVQEAKAPVAGTGWSSAVSAADPRASEAGRAILAQGGTAADAAFAVMLALTVVEPQSSGIGGGGFMVYHDAETGRLETFDGREEAPSGATPELFLTPDGKPMSFGQAVAGGKSVGVPGNFRLMARVHRRYGKLPWARLFDPAIRLARDGFAVTPRLHSALTGRREMLSRSAEARDIFYQPDGSPKPVGSTIRNPRLAALLEEIARHGAEHYYTGAPAERLVETVRNAPANPSTMTAGDVRAYKAHGREPVCGRYRVYRICGMGPPSSGGIAVYAILKQLERFDLAALGKDNPAAWHLIGESMRLAYADREQWIGDPDHVQVPTGGLVSDEYLAGRSALISPDKAMPKVSFGTPKGAPRVGTVPDTEVAGTSHFSVADRRGDVASMTSTIESSFGSGLVVDGYVLNNELTDFNFVPSAGGLPSANRVEPGKRPRSSMSPTIVYGPDNKVVAAVGAAGGPTIIAQVAKALIGILDWKLPAQDAIALPLVIGMGDQLRLEQGTALEAMAPQLKALGHTVTVTRMGLKANAVERTADGWRGGADPRSEGAVVGDR